MNHDKSLMQRWVHTVALLGVIMVLSSTMLSAMPIVGTLLPTSITASAKKTSKASADKAALKTKKSLEMQKRSQQVANYINEYKNGGQSMSAAQRQTLANYIDKYDDDDNASDIADSIRNGDQLDTDQLNTTLKSTNAGITAGQDSNSLNGMDKGADDTSDPLGEVVTDIAAKGASSPLGAQIQNSATAGNAFGLVAKGNSYLGITSKNSYSTSYLSMFSAKSDGSIDSQLSQENGDSDASWATAVKNAAEGSVANLFGLQGSQASTNTQNNYLHNEAIAASYGMALNQTGLDHSVNSGLGLDTYYLIGRALGGSIILLGNIANNAVDWMFSVVSTMAQWFNPVSWMSGTKVSDVDENDMDDTEMQDKSEAEINAPGPLKSVGYVFYQLFYYTQRVGLIGAVIFFGAALATGIMGWRLGGSGGSGQGIFQSTLKFLLRCFIILIIPLILAATLSGLMSQVSKAYSSDAPTATQYAIYSNLVDFQNWVQNSRLDLPDPPGANTGAGGTLSPTLVASPYAANQGVVSHEDVLAINAYSAGDLLAEQVLENDSFGLRSRTLLAASGYLNHSAEASKKVRILSGQQMALVNEWLTNGTYTAGDWTAYVKTMLGQTDSSGKAVTHVKSIMEDPSNSYGLNGTLTVGPGAKYNQPFVTASPFLISNGSSQHAHLSNPNGGLSTLAMYNYLSSTFDATTMTWTSSANLLNMVSAPVHKSVGLVGRGVNAVGNLMMMLALIWTSAILGYYFAMAAFWSMVKGIPKIFGFLLASATGSPKAVVKCIVAVLGVVIDLLGGAILYKIFQQLLIAMAQITNEIIMGTSHTNTLSGGQATSNSDSLNLFGFGALKHIAPGITAAGGSSASGFLYTASNIILAVLLFFMTFKLVQMRGQILHIFYDLVEGFFDTLFQAVDKHLGGAGNSMLSGSSSSVNSSNMSSNGLSNALMYNNAMHNNANNSNNKSNGGKGGLLGGRGGLGSKGRASSIGQSNGGLSRAYNKNQAAADHQKAAAAKGGMSLGENGHKRAGAMQKAAAAVGGGLLGLGFGAAHHKGEEPKTNGLTKDMEGQQKADALKNNDKSLGNRSQADGFNSAAADNKSFGSDMDSQSDGLNDAANADSLEATDDNGSQGGFEDALRRGQDGLDQGAVDASGNFTNGENGGPQTQAQEANGNQLQDAKQNGDKGGFADGMSTNGENSGAASDGTLPANAELGSQATATGGYAPNNLADNVNNGATQPGAVNSDGTVNGTQVAGTDATGGANGVDGIGATTGADDNSSQGSLSADNGAQQGGAFDGNATSVDAQGNLVDDNGNPMMGAQGTNQPSPDSLGATSPTNEANNGAIPDVNGNPMQAPQGTQQDAQQPTQNTLGATAPTNGTNGAIPDANGNQAGTYNPQTGNMPAGGTGNNSVPTANDLGAGNMATGNGFNQAANGMGNQMQYANDAGQNLSGSGNQDGNPSQNHESNVTGTTGGPRAAQPGPAGGQGFGHTFSPQQQAAQMLNNDQQIQQQTAAHTQAQSQLSQLKATGNASPQSVQAAQSRVNQTGSQLQQSRQRAVNYQLQQPAPTQMMQPNQQATNNQAMKAIQNVQSAQSYAAQIQRNPNATPAMKQTAKTRFATAMNQARSVGLNGNAIRTQSGANHAYATIQNNIKSAYMGKSSAKLSKAS